jgi:hypothetical protein
VRFFVRRFNLLFYFIAAEIASSIGWLAGRRYDPVSEFENERFILRFWSSVRCGNGFAIQTNDSNFCDLWLYSLAVELK